jgi:hypothetical protein
VGSQDKGHTEVEKGFLYNRFLGSLWMGIWHYTNK